MGRYLINVQSEKRAKGEWDFVTDEMSMFLKTFSASLDMNCCLTQKIHWIHPWVDPVRWRIKPIRIKRQCKFLLKSFIFVKENSIYTYSFCDIR